MGVFVLCLKVTSGGEEKGALSVALQGLMQNLRGGEIVKISEERKGK